jgi:hypothetical protein
MRRIRKADTPEIARFLIRFAISRQAGYMSKERRRHRMFVTRHSEYHLHDDQCVGVRDRGSGLWLLDHVALRLRALRLPSMGRDDDWVGNRIQFWGSRMDVVTSPVVTVARPRQACVDSYICRSVAGEIVV